MTRVDQMDGHIVAFDQLIGFARITDDQGGTPFCFASSKAEAKSPTAGDTIRPTRMYSTVHFSVNRRPDPPHAVPSRVPRGATAFSRWSHAPRTRTSRCR